MLDDDDSDEESEAEATPPTTNVPSNAVRDLKRQARTQAKQMSSMMDLIAQLTAQVMAGGSTPTVKKPKMTAPEKYEGGRTELRAFLTNIDLYCELNEVPNDQEKILTASMHMKGKAANWMQPYVEDYLRDRGSNGEKQDTQDLFSSWDNFKKEMGRIFGEVDAENQAEKAITRLRQTKSVSTYTAEFKQLQARIDWDDAALRTVFENGLKDTIKDSLVHHDKPEDLQAMIELATRIDNRLWERTQQKGRTQVPVANTKKHRRQVKLDREGDVIMTDKVQGKDRKSNKKRSDNLSKEERQKRYDSKACLRCGEVGHFRKDCPKNEETGKQGTIKIGMIRQGTPYPGNIHPSDSEVSDADLYEEARKMSLKDSEPVPKASGSPKQQDLEFVTSEVAQDEEVEKELPLVTIDARVYLGRHQEGLCGYCGSVEHHEASCQFKKHPIKISALGMSPYPRPKCTKKQKALWYECVQDNCKYHEVWKHLTGWYPAELREMDDGKTSFLGYADVCKDEECDQYTKLGEHEQHLWMSCDRNDVDMGCSFHYFQKHAATMDKEARTHGYLENEECNDPDCKTHAGKTAKGDRAATPETHKSLHWTFCDDDSCTVHYQAKKGAGRFPQKRAGKRGQRKN
jgi:hypothetical protein